VKVGGLGRSSFGICIGESTSDVAVVDLLRLEDDESVDEVENRSPILGEKPCRPEPEGRSRPPSATRFYQSTRVYELGWYQLEKR
jgi:hypothetical protein